MPKYILALGQSLDAVTFALFFLLVPPYILDMLGKSERNPVLLIVMQIAGVMGVVALKLLLSAWVIWRQKEYQHRFRIKFLTTAAGISGFIGAGFNTLALYQVSVVL